MNGQAGRHDPVLLEQAIEGLALEPGEVVVDGTFGAGGHSRRIVEEIAPDGVLIAVDRDPAVAEIAAQLAAGSPVTVHVVTDSYANIAANLRELGFEAVDGILLDLGLSSIQLDDPNRGFSFTHDGPLDMRFDPTRGRSAADLVSGLDREELANLIYKYGEERQSRRIASAIVRAREREPIRTTGQLAAIVEAAVGGRRGARIHPATRTFQALRIAVNDELGELERGLTAGIEILRPGGRFVVIAFHSLEDRIVKQTFQREIRGCICPPEIPVCRCGRVPRLRAIGKPVRASDSEIERNPRSRSAIMRVVERLP
ncbi:MAG: 16S rRNA (cytosine(1402)-N(4))-methyltransferase RsmH [Chloroflexota bacterium]